MIPPRIELGTFCVLGRCDNRYTTESDTSSPPTEQLMTRRKAAIAIRDGARSKQNSATAENRTRINCLEGNYANHYTTVAARRDAPHELCCQFSSLMGHDDGVAFGHPAPPPPPPPPEPHPRGQSRTGSLASLPQHPVWSSG